MGKLLGKFSVASRMASVQILVVAISELGILGIVMLYLLDPISNQTGSAEAGSH